MQHLEGSGTSVLYIGRMVLKGYMGISEASTADMLNTHKYCNGFVCGICT
jgi:hypothetical protein